MKIFKKTSFLQLLTHIGSILPLGILVWDFYTNQLTVNPIQAATQRTGKIALVLLVLSLACTPMNTIFHFPRILNLRKLFGLYAFLYASIHVLIFTVIDYGLDWRQILQTVTENQYLWTGITAFVILLALAITAIDYFKAQMGKNWKRLQRGVYLVGILVVVHYLMVIKGSVVKLRGDIFQPLLYGSVLSILLLLRLPAIKNWLIKNR
jgi:sulfoxide reductase heme-binding subunit YedZ